MAPATIHHLYANHYHWLRTRLQRRLVHAADAADVAQDTFMRILSAPDYLVDKNSNWHLDEPRAYLTVVAKRLVANLYRRRALEQAYLDFLAHSSDLTKPSPEHNVLILETLQQIDSMLDGLPTKVREAFLIAQLEGLTYAQIASQLSVSERTVKRYMVQAMARCILLMP
ncbi:MAG: sigma-70 family RNA polymerase sigma factor [Methylophilus sp.]|nr:sigma-70 family RNA polymerase sigma factor [Methylophilus sp.]